MRVALLITNLLASNVEIVVRTLVVEVAHFHVELIDEEVSEAVMRWNAHCPNLSLVTVWQISENFIFGDRRKSEQGGKHTQWTLCDNGSGIKEQLVIACKERSTRNTGNLRLTKIAKIRKTRNMQPTSTSEFSPRPDDWLPESLRHVLHS